MDPSCLAPVPHASGGGVDGGCIGGCSMSKPLKQELNSEVQPPNLQQLSDAVE